MIDKFVRDIFNNFLISELIVKGSDLKWHLNDQGISCWEGSPLFLKKYK